MESLIKQDDAEPEILSFLFHTLLPFLKAKSPYNITHKAI